MTTAYADAYGITHSDSCNHPQRVHRDGTRWRCNGCGSVSTPTPETPPTQERTPRP